MRAGFPPGCFVKKLTFKKIIDKCFLLWYIILTKEKETKKMSCMDCNCSFKDPDTGIWMCMADPNWPAPCEHDDYEENEEWN